MKYAPTPNNGITNFGSGIVCSWSTKIKSKINLIVIALNQKKLFMLSPGLCVSAANKKPGLQRESGSGLLEPRTSPAEVAWKNFRAGLLACGSSYWPALPVENSGLPVFIATYSCGAARDSHPLPYSSAVVEDSGGHLKAFSIKLYRLL